MTAEAHPRPRAAAPGHLVDRLRDDPLAAHVDWVALREDDLDRADLDRPSLVSPGIDGYVRASPEDAAPPGLATETVDRLEDPAVREHFVERLYAHARLRRLFTGGWTPGDLVAFHSRHKLQILAHDPAAYRAMGRIVAQAGVRPRDELEADYRRAFREAFAVHPSRGRHTNALMHVLGPMSSRLDQERRRAIVAAIESYHRGEVPLGTPVVLLRDNAEAEGLAYLAAQTYLDPYPPDLVPRI